MNTECPFPGMNPYLESPGYGRDFHTSFIGELRVQLAAVLPANYDALIDERVALIEMPSEAPMPQIRIPLQSPDDDVVVSLQTTFSETYRRHRYRKLIAYDRPLQTALQLADLTWAVETARR